MKVVGILWLTFLGISSVHHEKDYFKKTRVAISVAALMLIEQVHHQIEDPLPLLGIAEGEGSDRNLNIGLEIGIDVGLVAKRPIIWKVYFRSMKVSQEREKEKLVNEVAVGPVWFGYGGICVEGEVKESSLEVIISLLVL